MKINDIINEYINDLDVQKRLGNYDIEPHPSVAGKQYPNWHEKYPTKTGGLTDLSKQNDPKKADNAKIFIDKFEASVPPGYPHDISTERGKQGPALKLEYGGGTETSNGITCFITAGKASKIFNFYVAGINEQNKKPIFDKVTELGFTLGKSAKDNRQISISPSEKNNLDKSLKEFWTIVKAIEGLGKDFNVSDEPRSSDKLDTKLIDINYYMGTAGLIFVAARFMSGNLQQAKKLMPMSTNSSDGTLDIAPNIITKGITQTAADVQNGKIKGEQLTTVFAVPPDDIIEAGLKLLKKNDNDAVKITTTMKEDIIKTAELIRRNLVLVTCTQKEKTHIEATPMPTDWTPYNGHVLSRFQKLKINVLNPKNGDYLIEED